MNFIAGRADFVFSNYDPSLVSIDLETREVEISDARRTASSTQIDAEGFVLRALPMPDADLLNPEWVKDVYGPRIVDYLKELTGAAHVFPFRGHRVMIRDAGKAAPGRAAVADYVHIDQTERSGAHHVERDADPEIFARFPRAKIFNVWRPLTAPPQDVPLALCDQRTVEKSDWVLGKAREPGVDYATDTYSSVYNPNQQWYYFSDMTLDEMIVFKAWDNGPDAPIGCLHGAFRAPGVPNETPPRVSAESRYLCFFEA